MTTVTEFQEVLERLLDVGTQLTVLLSRITNSGEVIQADNWDRLVINTLIAEWDKLTGILPKTTEPRMF